MSRIWTARRARALVAALAASLTGAAGGCGSGERIAECDALLTTVEKAASCPKLSWPQRTAIEASRAALADSLDRLEDVGPARAPASVLDEARRMCSKQNEDIQRMYEKVAPECVR